MFVVVVASRRGFVIVLSLCEDKTSFPPPLFSLWIFLWHNQNFVSEFSTSIRNSFVNRDKFRAKFIFNCFAQRLMLEYKKGVIVIIVILGHTRTVELLIYLASVGADFKLNVPQSAG